jgi:hypothetical protein
MAGKLSHYDNIKGKIELNIVLSGVWILLLMNIHSLPLASKSASLITINELIN